MDDIHRELDEMSELMQIEAGCDDPVELTERLAKITAMHSRCGEIYVKAKKQRRIAVSQEIKEQIISIVKEGHLSAKAQNALLSCLAINEYELEERAERILSSLDKAKSATITLISYVKEELKNSSNQQY